MTQCVVVADDLTGSCDAGHEFAMRGYDTRVVVSPHHESSMSQGDVLVVNTESRYAEPEIAAERVQTAFERANADVAFKKVDSTLRGNVRVEVEAALDAVGAGIVLVAPAFPANGRLTAGGYHLVNGQLVTATSAGKDAERPPTHDALFEFFAESDYSTEHLDVGTVARGSGAVREALASIRSGERPIIVTCDALTDDHLGAVANAGADLSEQCLFVGSGGFARHIPVPGPASGAGVTIDNTQSVVGVSGSVAPETLAQIAGISQEHRRQLDLEMAVTDPPAASSDLASRGSNAVDAHGGVLLHSAEEESDVDRALTAGARAGVTDTVVRRRVTDALATAAAKVARDDPPSNLFLTGGATAIAVLDQLNAQALRMAGDAIEPGIPLATVVGGVADGATVVTKAGGFGDEQAIIKSLARIGFGDE